MKNFTGFFQLFDERIIIGDEHANNGDERSKIGDERNFLIRRL